MAGKGFVYGIVYSVKDPAGSGIARKLIGMLNPVKCSVCSDAVECLCGENYIVAGFREDVIFFEFLDSRVPAERYIVLSRHSSAAKVKSYTVHHTGNPGHEAPYGGRPRSLSVASPSTSYTLLRRLYQEARYWGRLREYDVSYEATHHGPTDVDRPLCFIEIGSTENEWADEVNHMVIAGSVRRLIENGELKCTPVIGIGGGHYPRKHTHVALSTSYCYGHIFAKYSLDSLDEEILLKAIERSEPRPKGFIVEKKGTRRSHRELIEGFAKSHGMFIEYI